MTTRSLRGDYCEIAKLLYGIIGTKSGNSSAEETKSAKVVKKITEVATKKPRREPEKTKVEATKETEKD